MPDYEHEAVKKIHLWENPKASENINDNKTKDGRIITCHWFNTPMLDIHAKVVGLTAVCQDITNQLKAEEELKESEEKHRNLFKTLVLGVVYQDADGNITDANPAAEQILGLSLDQMQGRTSMDPRWKAIHEDGSDFPGETHPAMVSLKTGEKVSNVTMGVFHPQKEEYRWININAIPKFRKGKSTPYEVYTTFDDITDSRKRNK